ncbi:MAG: bifunctional phosphoribosylaminoimidazolecarboxamide formyltransferase/IMP cyclohydrolase, partial [Verrucomicrobia bacterium]|nr:bifunctional phosphoribosylaminoimidazolecarboxamide formyltransferase/IMP cyclohydrolase [Verrucomicrobiota bacterium]
MKINRALISVSDKTGIAQFARRLNQMSVELISTGGTARLLESEGVPHLEIGQYTGFPEILDGRVKTLHPKVHGGLLFLRDFEAHQEQAAKHNIKPIDMVVANLYPFENTIKDPSVELEQAIEQIDIGGPSMLRSGAKNFRSVTVITDPADYDAVIKEMERHNGATTLPFREQLAIKVFLLTSRYDQMVANYLSKRQLTASSFTISLPLETRLRYGE